MFDLNATLGLQNVPSDPNDIPPSKYDATVTRSEYVLKKNGVMSHAVTYTVDDGQYKGAQVTNWTQIAKNLLKVDGTPAETVEEAHHGESLMTDQNKMYYKKMWVDHGIPEEQVDAGAVKPEDLIGIKVTVGTKKVNGFVNVSFVEKRTDPGLVTDMAIQPIGAVPTPVAAPAFTGQNPFPVASQPVASQPVQEAQPVQAQPAAPATDPWSGQPVQQQTPGLPQF